MRGGRRVIRGVLYLLSAALMFSLSTVFLKFATLPPYHVSPAFVTLMRFVMGFVLFSGLAWYYRERLVPNKPGAVAFRAVANTAAVILLFTAVNYTTVTKANILNLTDPAFIFLAAPFIANERQQWHGYILMLTTLCGAALVLLGGGAGIAGGVNRGDVLALSSGIVSGLAVSGLRQARKFDSSLVILFYQLAFGTAVSLVMLPSLREIPTGWGLGLALAAGLLSNVGQYFITEGYRYISAGLGGIVLESGILFGALFGIILFHDPLTLPVAAGGLLIIGSIALVSVWNQRARTARS